MNIIELFKKIRPYVKPYKWLVFATLILTLIGSLLAQVNAVVLDWTVDKVNALVGTGGGGFDWAEKVQGNFVISGVDFTCPNGNKALHDINMHIDSGKITALVGLSGAGKSTIVNLLDKFYTPDCGSITLDGVDLREYDIIYALKQGRVEQSGDPDDVYKQGGVYKDIVDASARSLNIEKLAHTLDVDGDGKFFNC